MNVSESPRRTGRPRGSWLLALAMTGCDGAEPSTPRAEDAPAECYSREEVPPLGLVEEDSQVFVDLDENGRILLQAIPTESAQSEGTAMKTAFLWDGGEPEALVIDGFLHTQALDMNERGEVLLLASPVSGWVAPWTDAFVWKDGELVAHIPAPSGFEFEFGRLNELGHVALSTSWLIEESSEPTPPQAFRWRDGEVDKLGAGEVLAFNDEDEIAGFDAARDAIVLWRATKRTELPTGCESQPTSAWPVLLDAHGRVVAGFECDGEAHTVLWEDEFPRELPKLAGNVFQVAAMNDRGEIVGTVMLGDRWVPVLWRDDELLQLPLPEGGKQGSAEAINEQGVLIGWFDGGFFVGSAAGTMALPLESLRETLDVGGLNERGDIVNGMGGEHLYGETSFVWHPTPCEDAEP